MSILIKGMDMPISCEKCPLCYDYLHCSIDDNLHMFLYNRHPDCPLIEIDADKLESHEEFDGYGFTKSVYADDIDDAPTILEAEEV